MTRGSSHVVQRAIHLSVDSRLTEIFRGEFSRNGCELAEPATPAAACWTACEGSEAECRIARAASASCNAWCRAAVDENLREFVSKPRGRVEQVACTRSRKTPKR